MSNRMPSRPVRSARITIITLCALLYIVVNPETPGHMLRLSGVFASDDVKRMWVAESPLGGGGTFTLRHHRDD